MHIIVKTVFFFLVSFSFFATANAQKATERKTTTSNPKFKPPKLTCFLGAFSDSVNIPTSEAETLIALPLKIYDSKKVEYTISSYNFLYRRKVVTEDEQTGKVSPASSMSAGIFKQTPLPALWIEQVRENLKPGEELFFFDIIAKDSQGRVMYASNLKIITL